MNENRNLHHFLNMSRNIHDVINAIDVRSIEISQAIAVQDGDVMAMENIAAAKSTGKSHQNLLMKFFILFVILIVQTFLKPDYYSAFKYLTFFK